MTMFSCPMYRDQFIRVHTHTYKAACAHSEYYTRDTQYPHVYQHFHYVVCSASALSLLCPHSLSDLAWPNRSLRPDYLVKNKINCRSRSLLRGKDDLVLLRKLTLFHIGPRMVVVTPKRQWCEGSL